MLLFNILVKDEVYHMPLPVTIVHITCISINYHIEFASDSNRDEIQRGYGSESPSSLEILLFHRAKTAIKYLSVGQFARPKIIRQLPSVKAKRSQTKTFYRASCDTPASYVSELKRFFDSVVKATKY